MNVLCIRALAVWFAVIAVLMASPRQMRAEHEGKLQILLLGDSTTIGSVCRITDPKGPHLEDVIRSLLAAEKDVPPPNVINQGCDGEFIHGLVSEGRYEREIASLPGIDYVLIRYGLNDLGKREDFDVNFPKDFSELIGRLRKDFPQATILPMTIIPYIAPEVDAQINMLVRKVADEEKLTLFDVYTRYQAELADTCRQRGWEQSEIPEGREISFHMFTLLTRDQSERDGLIAFLRGRGVSAVFHYVPLHASEMGRRFGYAEGQLPVTEDVSRRLVRLPFFTTLGEADQSEVIAAVRDFASEASPSQK